MMEKITKKVKKVKKQKNKIIKNKKANNNI